MSARRECVHEPPPPNPSVAGGYPSAIPLPPAPAPADDFMGLFCAGRCGEETETTGVNDGWGGSGEPLAGEQSSGRRRRRRLLANIDCARPHAPSAGNGRGTRRDSAACGGRDEQRDACFDEVKGALRASRRVASSRTTRERTTGTAATSTPAALRTCWYEPLLDQLRHPLEQEGHDGLVQVGADGHALEVELGVHDCSHGSGGCRSGSGRGSDGDSGTGACAGSCGGCGVVCHGNGSALGRIAWGWCGRRFAPPRGGSRGGEDGGGPSPPPHLFARAQRRLQRRASSSGISSPRHGGPVLISPPIQIQPAPRH